VRPVLPLNNTKMILKVFAKEEDFENDYLQEVIEKVADEGYEVESYDLDSDDAHTLAEIYNIMTSPSLVVAGNDGREVEVWRGRIPSVSEVLNFLNT
jgi:hypothetical protein